MKGNPKVLQFLNTVLRNELTAINQYFLHAKQLEHWGVGKLGKYERDESITEMKHANRIIERILFLEGLPNLQDLDRLLIGENVKEVLECDLKLELKALGDFRAAVAHAESVKDYVTRELLEEIMHEEEKSVDFIEVQFDLIKQIGIENYIQLQSSSAS
ncbi:bacterioferritin [Candidatus Binatus sp.]|uniref:bacterioferritin n=1 Tax=Candidatus Binatus sp. TaxID=2811406 RepID=UPI003CBC7742